MTAQTAIDALRAKSGIPNSINPNFHADTLQEIQDEQLLERSKVRGGAVPAPYSNITAYVVGDFVTEANVEYVCINDNAAGTITGRHGDYLGDINVTRSGTGVYTISAGGVLWDDATSVFALPKHTANQQMTLNYGISLGEVVIDVFQEGAAVNDQFSVAIYWEERGNGKINEYS